MREEVALSPLAYLPRAPRASLLSFAHLILSSACYADYASLNEVENRRHFQRESQTTASHLFVQKRLFHRPTFIRPSLFKPYESASRINPKVRGRISSVGRALDCRPGGRGFDPRRDPTNTQGLKITVRNEGTLFAL